MLKAILVDKEGLKIINSKHNTVDMLDDVMDCTMTENITRLINGKKYNFVIDNDRYLKRNKTATATCLNKREYLYGNILITNLNNDGSLKSLTKEEVKDIMDYSPNGFIKYKI